MRVPVLTGAALLGLSTTGCFGAPGESIGDSEPSTSSTATAVVVVERTSGPADAVRDTVVARFVRVQRGPVDDAALRIAGVTPEEIPLPGTCIAGSASAPNTILPRSVELLDVGGLAVEPAQAGGTLLFPRSMPDPAGVVSGVFYSSRAIEGFVPGARLTLRATGGRDLAEGFAVNVATPREISDVHVARSASGLEVAWELDEDVRDARDTVFVDVLAPAPHLVARCAPSDADKTSRLVVPQAAIEGIDEGQLVVHRVRREVFHAKGIEPGEVRFDLARVVTFGK